MHVKVFKVGVQTGLTEGTVKFVDNNLLMVQGDNETVFAKSGDSGSSKVVFQPSCLINTKLPESPGFANTVSLSPCTIRRLLSTNFTVPSVNPVCTPTLKTFTCMNISRNWSIVTLKDSNARS
jgi:hypothetical protein